MTAAEAKQIVREALNTGWVGKPGHDALDLLDAELAWKDAMLREIGGFVAYVLRYSRMVPTTISLGTMVGYAIGGAMPAGWEYPCDTADLARCEWVRQVAPAVLHARMDEYLVRARATLVEQP